MREARQNVALDDLAGDGLVEFLRGAAGAGHGADDLFGVEVTHGAVALEQVLRKSIGHGIVSKEIK